MEIKWEDPPEEAILRARGGNGQYVEFAIALRAHEERWALLPDLNGPRTPKAAQNAAQNIRRGLTKGFDKGQYEAVTDEGKIYVRYMPKELPAEDGEPEAGTPRANRQRSPEHGAAIRTWARNNGFEVADRGALPQEVVDAYHKAMDRQEQGKS